jgi:DNA-binding MarR family transcriptional regulator
MAAARARHEFLARDEYEAWNGLLTLTQSVLRRLDDALRAEVGLSVTEFDVLITLFNANDRQLGMSDLAASVRLSPSGLTHLVTRMERDGLLARQGDPADRRKFFTRLTDAGAERLRLARRTHNAVLRQVLLPHLDAADRAQLGALGRRLEESVGSAGSRDPHVAT